MEQNTRSKKAIRACAEWLASCLQAGWSRDSLDKLEATWWEWHDDQGKVLDYPRDTPGEAIDRTETK